MLQNDDGLRQGIMAQALGNLTNSDDIFETKIQKFDFHAHSGLRFQSDDYNFIVDLAFEGEVTQPCGRVTSQCIALIKVKHCEAQTNCDGTCVNRRWRSLL